ncbi:MAG: SGNH/GDSL hydrolase family protein [Lachnospiraceae bacterium]|nr:SGNH/GDSL hydrolase family protein [Lachnospiraceae bacterium]
MKGPRAPKDPTAKRPAVYVMVDAVIEGSPRGNGKFQDICYLNGRIAQKISVICEDISKEIIDLIPTGEGFRKVVHSVGITVLATKEEMRSETVTFELSCLTKVPDKAGSCYSTKVPCNGEEAVITVADYPENEADGLLGSFITTFPSHETAKLTVCFYLNDGYTAPELKLDPPVDFDSEGYQAILERSLVQTGNLYRIQRAIAKAQRGEEVVLAYLGGSITQGAGAKPINSESYAYRSYQAFKKRFGKGDGENVRLVKAGAGGTCSELGLTRYETDVLRRGTVTPDILFLEYAVNDAGDETDGVCFESLVRMAMEGPGKPAVILLFAVFMSDFNLQERMIPVGERFKLPMISIRNAVVPQFSQEKPVITKRQFFYDLFHPSNDGHRVMADCIDYFWNRAAEAAPETEDAVIGDTPAIGETYRALRAFDRSNYGEHAAVKELSCGAFEEKDVMLQYVEQDDHAYATPEFPENWMKAPGKSGEPFCMRLCCKDLLLVYKDTGDTGFGKVEVRVDKTLTRTVDPLEIGWNHCNAYIVYQSEEAAEHEVEISMKAEDADKGFTILGFGYTLE